MKLANLEPLTKNILGENSLAPTVEEGNVVMQSEAEGPMGSDQSDLEKDGDVSEPESEEGTAAEPEGDDLELSDEPSGETAGEEAHLDLSKDQVKTLFKMILQATGLEGDVSDAEGSEETDGMEDMGGAGGEEGAPPEMELQETEELEETEELDEAYGAKKGEKAPAKKAPAKEGEKAPAKKGATMPKPTKKMEESLSEDSLVEAVLARVTARLMQEAKKQKQNTKDRMKQKVQEKLMQEASESKGGGPLVNKGGNKYDTYKGHPDMEMGKGENGGKGGHKLEKMTAKAEHTVTHGGKNLATLGGNKA